MIRAEFLSPAERAELTGLARNGLVEHRLARRANALVLLDRGMSCAEVSSVFLLDDERFGAGSISTANAGSKVCPGSATRVVAVI